MAEWTPTLNKVALDVAMLVHMSTGMDEDTRRPEASRLEEAIAVYEWVKAQSTPFATPVYPSTDQIVNFLGRWRGRE